MLLLFVYIECETLANHQTDHAWIDLLFLLAAVFGQTFAERLVGGQLDLLLGIVRRLGLVGAAFHLFTGDW